MQQSAVNGADHAKMTTIADELLNDFEDSGSEKDEEEQSNDFFGAGVTSSEDFGDVKQENGGMELDGDEEEPDEADIDGGPPSHLKMEDAEDEEETKARVEKMELKTVSDVRNVAGLMKQLDPVIEVSHPLLRTALRRCNLHLPWAAFLTYRRSCRKSNTTGICHQISRPRMSAAWKIIRNTSYLRSQTPYLRASMAR